LIPRRNSFDGTRSRRKDHNLLTRRLIVCIFAAVFFGVTATPQQLLAVKPDSVGLSSERLEGITKTVQQNTDDKRIGGAVALVLRHGQVASGRFHMHVVYRD
jgi:uncharacterized lipoprotein YajG